MIKNLIRIFKKKDAKQLKYPSGKRYYPESHSIRKEHIDNDALKIIYRLQKFNYKAYVVGGCIRDLLVGRKPKDFDIVTNATPNQIKKIFGNCRIIGKRFKIVHIIYKRKIIEVSTFRSLPEHRSSDFSKNKDYLLKKDNSYGSLQEDIARRDITINSLLFDIRNETIIDFVGGVEDIEKKQVSTVSDSMISFQEDPVRMLRTIKFATLLNFEIDPKTQKSIKKSYLFLKDIPPARMFEEYNKIFKTTKSVLIFKQLAKYGILQLLFKEAFEIEQKVEKNLFDNFETTQVGKYLDRADKFNSERDYMSHSIFYCILFSNILAINPFKQPKNLTLKQIKEKLHPIFESLQLSTKERIKITYIFFSQKNFIQIEDEEEIQKHPLIQKYYYKDAFNLFRISAIVDGDQKEMKYIFNWEIAVKKRLMEKNEEKIAQKNQEKET